MNTKDLSIKNQLIAGFVLLLIFVVGLGWIAFDQNRKLQQQKEILYNHPIIVQRATSDLSADINAIQRDLGDLLIAENESELLNAIKRIEIKKGDAKDQINTIKNHYLGSPADVDSVNIAFTRWEVTINDVVNDIREGNAEEAGNRIQQTGDAGMQVKELKEYIGDIEEFAQNKEKDLYQAAVTLNRTLNNRMLGMLVAILLLTLIIYFILLKNISQPLRELSRATRRFHEGDMNARSGYSSSNEFGKLSESFNELANKIQGNIELHKRFSSLTELMLNENDPRRFFKVVLKALIEETGSRMAVAYLLDEEKQAFIHYESIGAGEQARQAFSAEAPEGELGLAISSGKIQHITNIQSDSRFLFYTSAGKIVPGEIITIPVSDNEETVAVISLCHTNQFTQESVHLVKMLCDTLNTRVQSVLMLRRLQRFSEQLEAQNSELEAQKDELVQQSSELTEQNAELERQRPQLDEASRFKTSFLSNMGHEVRTPLNSVIALTGVLSRRLAGKIPEEEHSYLEVVERNGKHLLSLINDILDLSRIESGREEINISEFNACTVIEEVVDMLQPQAKHKGIELTKTCDTHHYPVTTDAAKIRHILINLIGNAVKFTEKGKVEVICSGKENAMEVIVADTGIGIEENYLPYVFDEFKQADSSTSRKFGGTGLGLAIARKYAHMLGGELQAKSTFGKGSEFTLTLPLQYDVMNRISSGQEEADTENPKKSGSEHSVISPVEKTVLLVDDSEPAIIQMTDILQEYGYNVLVAGSGEQALEIVEKTIPDAIVLDLMMPRMDGFQVLRTLREAEPTAHVPVLILTARHITKEELAFLKRNNVHQLIQKGDVNRNDLLQTIRNLMFPELKKPLGNRMRSVQGKPLALVVEDNPDNMITVKALLSEHYNVVEAVNGRQGVEMAKKHRPHFILMDIALPEMNGIEAFKIIRKDSNLAHIPVIALTASALTSDREVILAHGFDAYIPKPLDDKPFFETLDATLYGK
ncbi:MAG: response regulator [Mariniphaga sp.]